MNIVLSIVYLCVHIKFIYCVYVLVPTQVRNLKAVPMIFSIVFTWSEPVPLNGILNRYTIRYSVNGSSEITNTTRDTTFSITDLNPNTVVSNIRVIAATGAGDGPPQMLNDVNTLDRYREFVNIHLYLYMIAINFFFGYVLIACLLDV